MRRPGGARVVCKECVASTIAGCLLEDRCPRPRTGEEERNLRHAAPHEIRDVMSVSKAAGGTTVGLVLIMCYDGL